MSTHRKAWTTYIVLRLVFFVVPFGALYALGLALGFSMMLSGIIAAVLAALIGVSLSILLLSKPREEASESIYAWRNRDRTVDDVAEDAALDSEAAPQPSAPAEHHAAEMPGQESPAARGQEAPAARDQEAPAARDQEAPAARDLSDRG